jgi:4'-phosphopantetheinyl transferase
MKFNIYCRGKTSGLTNQSREELNIYYGTTHKLIDRMPSLYNYLSADEKNRADRFKFKKDLNCYISVHSLLRLELSKYLGIDALSIKIGHSENGKPYIEGIDLPFSLSRSEPYFTFVVGTPSQSIGIDIERRNSRISLTDITRDHFSFEEQKSISGLVSFPDKINLFYELWTRKEAFLKAIGIGINTDLDKISVLDGDNQADIGGMNYESYTFFLKTLITEEAIISLASSGDFNARLINLTV